MFYIIHITLVITFVVFLPISSYERKSDHGVYLNKKHTKSNLQNLHKYSVNDSSNNEADKERKYLVAQLRREFAESPKFHDDSYWDHMVPVIKGSKYVFSHEPVRRDIYLYNEIFNPSEPDHLNLNYFNSWFDPNFDKDPHVRERRSTINLYKGDSDVQFTLDTIEEYLNLKNHKIFKRKPKSISEAFQRIEQDLAKLAQVKSKNKIYEDSRNKLSIDPDQGNIEVDSNMPSDVEHLDRNIIEEVVRVYIPKTRIKRLVPTLHKSFSLKNLPIQNLRSLNNTKTHH